LRRDGDEAALNGVKPQKANRSFLKKEPKKLLFCKGLALRRRVPSRKKFLLLFSKRSAFFFCVGQ